MTRILLSALAARGGGGTTYLRNIVATFPRSQNLRLSILSHEGFEGVANHPDVEWIRAPRWTEPPVARFLLGFFYFRFFWRRRHDFDLIFYASGSFELPAPGPVTRVVAFHNMLPFDRAARRRYGLGGMRLRNRILRFVQAHALRRADLVIFISEHGRRTIDRALGRRRGASALIHHGAARDGEPLDPPVARRLPRRFVLYLSTVHPYKAQLELIHAWSLLRARGPLREKLVLAGAFHAPYVRRLRETIARHGLEQEVVLLGPVAPDQIFDLAGRAVLNLFLSTCENCPITLLELMSVGRPLLVSSRPPMPELGGPDLSYVDPCDISAVANAIASLLADDEARRRLGEAAARRAPMFSWARCGAATWAAIQAVADEAAPSSSSASDSPATARR